MKKRIAEEVERLRSDLYELINKNESLISSKVISLSQRLDNTLNMYNRLSRETKN